MLYIYCLQNKNNTKQISVKMNILKFQTVQTSANQLLGFFFFFFNIKNIYMSKKIIVMCGIDIILLYKSISLYCTAWLYFTVLLLYIPNQPSVIVLSERSFSPPATEFSLWIALSHKQTNKQTVELHSSVSMSPLCEQVDPNHIVDNPCFWIFTAFLYEILVDLFLQRYYETYYYYSWSYLVLMLPYSCLY